MVLSTGVSVRMELGYAHLLAHECIHQIGSSLNPIAEGFLWRLYVGKMDYYLNLHPLCPPQSMEHGAESSKLSWFGLSGDQPPL